MLIIKLSLFHKYFDSKFLSKFEAALCQFTDDTLVTIYEDGSEGLDNCCHAVTLPAKYKVCECSPCVE